MQLLIILKRLQIILDRKRIKFKAYMLYKKQMKMTLKNENNLVVIYNNKPKYNK